VTPPACTVAETRTVVERYIRVVTAVTKAHESAPTGQTAALPDVRAPTLTERAVREAYSEAVKKALESRDDTCGAIITASLSILTAYAAVITLVTPKSQQPIQATLIPFVFLAAAFASAAIGKLAGVRVGNVLNDNVTRDEDANDVVKSANRWKFWAALAAIVLITVGVLTAASSLVQMYAHTPNLSDSQTVKFVYLNEQGRALVANACGTSPHLLAQRINPAPELTGTVTVSDGFATVSLSDPGTCNQSRTVSLPTSAVGFIRTAH